MLRKWIAVLALCALLASPAAGFDTFWHTTVSKAVGQTFGFSPDAANILQLGNFSPDFFGPVAEYASGNLNNPAFAAFNQMGTSDTGVRQFAIFLHFDNLNQQLNSNSRFDYLFSELLQTTRSLLADYNTRQDVDARTRKILVLITLGASLHAVQDFYSHSDWIHNDFNKTKVKMARLPGGDERAPTWFEFRDKMGNPDKWPFQVRSGIYPPIPGVQDTHTRMNHDNSRLLYREYENPGQPLKSEAPYHNSGAEPAHEGDAASIRRHQQLAVNTAIAASIEWVRKVEQNAGARAAIESAREWDLKNTDSRLAKELQAGIAAEMAVSCAAGKWDGEDPPPASGAFCQSVLQNQVGSMPGGESGIASQVLGLAAGLGVPLALRYTGRFWSVHSRYNILGRLAESIGTATGDYNFKK